MARVGAQGLGEALEWLYGTQLFGVKLGLDGMRRLAAALGVWAMVFLGIAIAGAAALGGKRGGLFRM